MRRPARMFHGLRSWGVGPGLKDLEPGAGGLQNLFLIAAGKNPQAFGVYDLVRLTAGKIARGGDRLALDEAILSQCSGLAMVSIWRRLAAMPIVKKGWDLLSP